MTRSPRFSDCSTYSLLLQLRYTLASEGEVHQSPHTKSRPLGFQYQIQNPRTFDRLCPRAQAGFPIAVPIAIAIAFMQTLSSPTQSRPALTSTAQEYNTVAVTMNKGKQQ
ncbi:hypothetical protein BCV70DRAFT_39399 [Testicularia cyperi]|uniref:Uncharacterized protein n=1 Tax=Testicularia cyperi TaxID=1882483 RepID=A0A317XIE7_9BASI|nr:hypothetical protein BCV70DRAFT_39399 [Testicularia cyperi]